MLGVITLWSRPGNDITFVVCDCNGLSWAELGLSWTWVGWKVWLVWETGGCCSTTVRSVTVKISFGMVTLTVLVEVSKALLLASDNAGGKADWISNTDGLLLSRGSKLLVPTQFSVHLFDWSRPTLGSESSSFSASDSPESSTAASSITAWARRCLNFLPVLRELACSLPFALRVLIFESFLSL